MALTDYVSDSEDSADSIALAHTPKKSNDNEQSPRGSVLSHRFRASSQVQRDEQPLANTSTSMQKTIAVMVQGPSRPWEYQPFVADRTVDEVLAEIDMPGGEVWYRIEYEDGRREDVSLAELLTLRNGRNALDFYTNGDEDLQSDNSNPESSQFNRSSAEPSMSSLNGKKRTRTKTKPQAGFVSSFGKFDLDEEDSDDQSKKRRRHKGEFSLSRPLSRATRNEDDFDDSESDARIKAMRRSRRHTKLFFRSTRNTLKDKDPDELADNQVDSDRSDIGYSERKTRPTRRTLRGRATSKAKSVNSRRNVVSDSSPEPLQPSRKSGRDRGVIKSMKEHHEDEEEYAVEAATTQSKVISIREVFQPVSKDLPFYQVHSNQCDICQGSGSNSNKGISQLIHCQGCSSSIHKICLGYRSAREPIVTKVGQDNFVMQCRRCIGAATKKDPLAPRLECCQECKNSGLSCAAFSSKKSSKQEEKLREENDGDDPATEVPDNLVNNADNVLFRCKSCRRAWHFEHLPPLLDDSKTTEVADEMRELRLDEYFQWKCKECNQEPPKVQTLVSWRPVDPISEGAAQTVENFREDEREYLVKWTNKSYSKCTWMPGAWVWGRTASVMRKAFFDRDNGANHSPVWSSAEAIRKGYLRMEIIFMVKYDGHIPHSYKSDKKHMAEVEQVYVKYIGLGYDDAVWEEPPSSNDKDIWADYVAAYNEYLAGIYFKSESTTDIKNRIKDFRTLDFEEDIEYKAQPSCLVGGKLMDYQKDGMNWLLYNFHKKKNVILADEMGLGKTIQIIAFLAALITDQPECWPFLIVTPNSTCPNWRREIKKWAPTVRVVAYYGGKKAREMASDFELFPGGSSDMRAHVVVTSYDAPVNDHFFKKINWAGLIVDEGQRLKNDEGQLYLALQKLNFPFQVLLTGTPLQNNKRELFNLLQFLDPKIDAAKLDEEYRELTKENMPKLHDMIRPYFLRRMKLQVLGFLPPISQVILPVTMSVLQKKLYKSILEKNASLIQQIMGKRDLKVKERGNLSNILMQLRKCLCHPYIYNDKIEDRSLDEGAQIRNMIDAASKFRLLEIMLPKLRDRGSRVLIFSQFLDQLNVIEDFLSHLGLRYQRLDGEIDALEKQRRIDMFNAPGSELFAFLLSTRAGGVGINLATADTVIIMDPDHNPHQDIQAISRAHRIGQEKPVLVFQLMTKGSAEERMIQVGRKKMTLDQVIVESMDLEDPTAMDVESILKHGAKALFENDDSNDIHYDSASVDKLLDRTKIETTKKDSKSADAKFSFARVWANDKGTLDIENSAQPESAAPDIDWWEETLSKRLKAEAAEASKQSEDHSGRGKRQRKNVNYNSKGNPELEGVVDEGEFSPEKQRGRKRGRKATGEDDSSTEDEYHAAEPTYDDDEFQEPSQQEQIDVARELQPSLQGGRSRSNLTNQGTNGKTPTKSFNFPKPPISGKTSRESAKVQQRTQKSMNTNVAKKAGVCAKPQPKMDTAVKQTDTAKNDPSAGKMQQAQINGRTAMPNCSKAQAQLNTNTSGKKQQASLSNLPTTPHGVTTSTATKESARPSGVAAAPPNTTQPPKASQYPDKKQVALIKSLPAKPNGVHRSQFVPSAPNVARTKSAAGISQDSPIKRPSESSDQRSQASLKIRNAPSDLSQASTQQTANTASTQSRQDIVALNIIHSCKARIRSCQPRDSQPLSSLSPDTPLDQTAMEMTCGTPSSIPSPVPHPSYQSGLRTHMHIRPKFLSLNRRESHPSERYNNTHQPRHTITIRPIMSIPPSPPADRDLCPNNWDSLRSTLQFRDGPLPLSRKSLKVGNFTLKGVSFSMEIEMDILMAEGERNAKAERKFLKAHNSSNFMSQVQLPTERETNTAETEISGTYMVRKI